MTTLFQTMLLRTTLASLLVCLAGLANSPSHAAEKGMNNERPTVRNSEKYGLNFFYSGDKDVKAFLNATPCVSGVSWKFHREDEEHYIGELHYPTENTGAYDTDDPQKMSPLYYMVWELKIRKQDGLPINLKEFQGALVLRDPKPDVPLATRDDQTSYELVGYQDLRRQDRAYNFLFKLHADLKYQPPSK